MPRARRCPTRGAPCRRTSTSSRRAWRDARSAGPPSEAGSAPGVEVDVLAHRHESEPARARAKRSRGQFVLDREHGLAGADKRRETVALVVLEALLVERPVEARLEGAHLVEVVLEPNREPARMRRAGEEAVVGELVGAREREAARVRVPVDVVGLDAVEAL